MRFGGGAVWMRVGCAENNTPPAIGRIAGGVLRCQGDGVGERERAGLENGSAGVEMSQNSQRRRCSGQCGAVCGSRDRTVKALKEMCWFTWRTLDGIA